MYGAVKKRSILFILFQKIDCHKEKVSCDMV